jgi:hypothetical protein
VSGEEYNIKDRKLAILNYGSIELAGLKAAPKVLNG